MKRKAYHVTMPASWPLRTSGNKGTNYAYRHEGKVYFIGDKNLSGIASTQLVRLKHNALSS